MKRASLIFLKNNNKILLQLRDNKPTIYYPNYWAPIGGEIEDNETPLEAAKRESNEEIGCDVLNIKFLKKMDVADCPLCEDHIIFLFKGEIDKKIEEISLTEGQKVDYFNFMEFKGLKFPEFLKDFIIKNKDEFF